MELKVLDHGYVKYIEHWGSDERIIESARMSTGKGFQGWETDAKLLAFLYNNKHTTPFEMAGLTIEVKAPIFVFREWHRHRTQSYNEMSARYIPLPNENYLPDRDVLFERSQKAHSTTNRQASGTDEPLQSREHAHDTLIALEIFYNAADKLYHELLENGWPKELARLCVPVARYSRMRASANLRNWLTFLTLRYDKNAQWEIQQYAGAVARIIEQHFNRTYELWHKEKFDG